MSKADADTLRRAWDYIERNGFRRGGLGYEKPGDECSACALGALAASAQLDVAEIREVRDPFSWIVEHTLPAARYLDQARTTAYRGPSTPHVGRNISYSIWRYNDNRVRDIDGARQWFADAIALAESDA